MDTACLPDRQIPWIARHSGPLQHLHEVLF
jgi:hypothetical protein